MRGNNLNMAQVIDLMQYQKAQELKRNKAVLLKKMGTRMTKNEADYTFLQILDLFCQKYHPDIYRKFELFINGKLD